MSPLLISVTVFIGVAALVGALALMFRGSSGGRVEERLDVLAGVKSPSSSTQRLVKDSLVAHLQAAPNIFDAIVKRIGNLAVLFEQADTTLTPARFFLISAVLALVGAVVTVLAQLSLAVVPFAALALGVLPLLWLILRRRRRMAKFQAQLPGALELVSRALRAGHSLASGMSLVAEEMQPPIRQEFQRVFESQNLGIAMEEALKGMTLRVPNLDLKFFVTAVILQRQTGGDLAEILDKIGHLVRERFRIWGQVQALTGEGRLSGLVLLGLPPVLFLAVYYLNPGYVMMLFTDPMGKQMLAGAVVLQVLGALVIKKIVNIKV
jgi:tight adherence protein B